MARNDKQLSYEERYQQKMEQYKEVYKIRTDFASKFKLDTKKAKGLSTETIVNNASGSSSGSASKPSEGTEKGVTIEGGSELGRKIAEEAAKFVGKCVYRWAGKDPTTGGADCSGFTSYIYRKHASLEIGGSTTAQVSAGTMLESSLVIDGSKALPGDLILFQGTYRAGVSHVGIVYSWPKIVHCAGKEGTDGVQYSDMSTNKYWQSKFLSIRRVISDNGSADSGSKKDASAKAMATIQSTTEIENTNPWGYTSDDDGMDIYLLNGGERTSSPGAPAGYFTPPLHWFEVGASYTPVPINITAQHIRIPTNTSRANFFHKRIKWGMETGYSHFQKLNPSNFIHITRHDGFEGNLYSPDAAKAFEILRLKSKREKLEILSGFRFSPEGLISPHEAGCAIDIRVYGIEDARKLADVAWACGFRAIAIGGDITSGGGFIHIDIGPKDEWGYDNIPAYRGPGRWSLNETE
jgi:cell wall-associated NlpC family hydrolase